MQMTSSHVKRFYREFARETGVKFVSRGWISWLIGRKLPEPGAEIADRIDKALRPCALKNIVLLDHCIGDSTPWVDQVMVAVHEATHALQIRLYVAAGGTVSGWYRDYFHPGSRGSCAMQEAGACAAEDEVRFYLFGHMTGLSDLSGYFLTPQAMEMARSFYDVQTRECKRLGQGGSTFDSSSAAIRVLRRIGIGG